MVSPFIDSTGGGVFQTVNCATAVTAFAGGNSTLSSCKLGLLHLSHQYSSEHMPLEAHLACN